LLVLHAGEIQKDTLVHFYPFAWLIISHKEISRLLLYKIYSIITAY